MDERKFRILQAIIDDYILTGIPVGSRTISKKYDMGLSSATIRNEMSDLEELGYLDQPHVSSGRIPSAKAYRLYVDTLLQNDVIENEDTESLRHHFSNRANQMEDVIHQAAQVLSGLTHYTAVVMSPKGSEIRLRNLQLVQVNSQSALLVIVTDGGIIRDTVIPTGSSLDAEALHVISRHLTELLSGCTLREAVEKLTAMPESEIPIKTNVSGFLESVSEGCGKAKIALGSPSNILNYPEYSNVEKARGFLSLLEEGDKLENLLEHHGEMAFTVRIGPETGVPELSDCSLVTASYHLGDRTHGTIGIIGPTRMQYGKVFSILNAMGKQLSDLLDQE